MDALVIVDLILSRANAERMLPPMMTRLVKLLYLTEVEYFRRTKSRLTNLDWKFYHYGPYPPSLRQQLGDPNVETHLWTQGRRSQQIVREQLTDQPNLEHTLAAVVGDVVRQWGDADLNDLLDYVYFETEPMQSARRGDYLDFSVIEPLASKKPIRIDLDKKRLIQIRSAITQRASAYGKLREAAIAPDDLFENLRVWDSDRTAKLRQGECSIDIGKLSSTE